jgi:hypothetical protein
VKLIGVLAIVAVVVLWPAGAGASNLRGVVVGTEHGKLLVATANGVVRATRGRASIGARLNAGRVVGHATRAHVHGIVVKRVGTTVFLSSNKHLLAVQNTQPVAPGSVVNSTVAVKQNGELEEEDEDDVGRVSGTIAIQATITAVGTGTVTLSVNGQSLTVNLPGGLALPQSLVGQTVALNVSLNSDDNDDQGDDDHDGHRHGGGGDDD